MYRLLTFLWALCIVSPVPGFAQPAATSQGSFLIGGNASFTSTGWNTDREFDNDRTVALLVNPSVQYFVMDRLALGGSGVITRYSQGDDAATSLGFGPAASYFFGPTDAPLHPFVSANASFVRATFSGGEDAATNFSYRASGGVLFLLAPGVGITGELFYNALRENDTETSENSFGLALGVAAFVF